MRRPPIIVICLVAVGFVLTANSHGASAYGTDPAADFVPDLIRTKSTPLQVVVGPTNPPPAVLSYPVNFSAFWTFNQTNKGWKVGTVVGALGADVWVKALSSQWSVSQTGWAGGTVNGGAATGTGFGIYYQSPKGILSMLKLGVSGGLDAVSGQKTGLYVGLSALGMVKF